MNLLMMKIMYPCSKIREFLYDYAEGTLDPYVALRFKLHISICKGCEEYVRIYRMTADVRSFRKRSPPPQEFVDRTKEFLEKNGLADFSEDPGSKGPSRDL
jgi:Putative zinc-finger